MTQLVWDQVGDRQFETGIERGVIYPYLPGPVAVPWSGLVQVTESPGRELKEYFQDGVKVFQRLVGGAYSAKIQAITYPSVIDDLMGNPSLAPGVNLHDQQEAELALTYRTRIGNQDQGTDYAYTLHYITGLAINPSDISFQTIADQPSPNAFEFTLTGVQGYSNNRKTSHISVDSRLVDPAKLAQFEAFLYGTETDDPSPMEIDDAIYWLTQ